MAKPTKDASQLRPANLAGAASQRGEGRRGWRNPAIVLSVVVVLATLALGATLGVLFVVDEWRTPVPPLAGSAAEKLAAAMRGEGEVLVLAHRGDNFLLPDNSVAAVERAESRGIDGVVIDVALTRDEKLVAHHELHLGAFDKPDERVRDYDARDLEALGEMADDEHHLLPSVERLMGRFGESLLMVLRPVSAADEARAMAVALCGVEQRKGAHGALLVTTSDAGLYEALRESCAKLAVVFAVNFEPSYGYDAAVPKGYAERLVGVRHDHCTLPFMHWARGRFAGVYVYAPRLDRALRELLGMGVRMIATDRPGRLMRLREEARVSGVVTPLTERVGVGAGAKESAGK